MLEPLGACLACPLHGGVHPPARFQPYTADVASDIRHKTAIGIPTSDVPFFAASPRIIRPSRLLAFYRAAHVIHPCIDCDRVVHPVRWFRYVGHGVHPRADRYVNGTRSCGSLPRQAPLPGAVKQQSQPRRVRTQAGAKSRVRLWLVDGEHQASKFDRIPVPGIRPVTAFQRPDLPVAFDLPAVDTFHEDAARQEVECDRWRIARGVRSDKPALVDCQPFAARRREKAEDEYRKWDASAKVSSEQTQRRDFASTGGAAS